MIFLKGRAENSYENIKLKPMWSYVLVELKHNYCHFLTDQNSKMPYSGLIIYQFPVYVNIVSIKQLTRMRKHAILPSQIERRFLGETKTMFFEIR